VYGPQGSGKTTLSIKLVAQVLRSYSRALRSVVFTRQELEDRIRASIRRLGLKEPVKKLRKLECKRREQVIIWDDASAHADKYMVYSDREYAQRLGITFDLIRRVAACVIVTTPSPARLLKVSGSRSGSSSSSTPRAACPLLPIREEAVRER